MVAILGGPGAAASSLTAARAGRLIGAGATLGWVMPTVLAVVGPLVIAEGRPAALGARSAAWLALGGGGNVAGLLPSCTARFASGGSGSWRRSRS